MYLIYLKGSHFECNCLMIFANKNFLPDCIQKEGSVFRFEHDILQRYKSVKISMGPTQLLKSLFYV